MVQALQVPGCAVFAPSEPAEIGPALTSALETNGPALVRYPKTLAPGPLAPVGSGLDARLLRAGDGAVLLVGIGKLARACVQAAEILAAEGIDVTVYDPRVIRPADPELLEQMASARLVVTAEDGLGHGGAGSYLLSEVELLAARRAEAGPRSVILGVPTTYLAHAKPDAILSNLGLDGPGIAESVRAAVRRFSILSN
jgi:1-deoxy-D-xylulose-5-phosphate synthase